MDEKQRKHLDGNLMHFTKQLDIVGILPSLQQSYLLLDHHVEQVNALTTRSEKAHLIIRTVKTRGPDAYQKFYDCLVVSEQKHLADLLGNLHSKIYVIPFMSQKKEQNGNVIKSVSPSASSSGSSLSSLNAVVPEDPEIEPPSYESVAENRFFYQGYEGETVKPTCGLMKDLKVECVDSIPSGFNKDDIYENFSKPKGLALLINNRKFDRRTLLPERIGTDIDKQNIGNLLFQLGYQVKIKENLKGVDMFSAMARFSLKTEHQNCDSTVVVVLTHGAKGIIHKLRDACSQVSEQKSALAMNKFLNCDHVIYGWPPLAGLDMADANVMRNKIPTDADTFVAYATTPGYVSWRNSVRGSWFIQAICHVFATSAATEDLLSLMTKVNQRVANSFESSTGHKQIPEPCFRLTKKFFFFPGLFRS